MTFTARRIAAGILSLLLVAGGSAFSQTYPDKPIRLIVGFAPGGGTDLLARLVGQKLSERVGQPVIVDNRPGANMIIGQDATAKAAPDGYTLGMAAVPTVTNPSLHSKLPFDTNKDFTWITQLTTASLVLLVNNSVPATSVGELIALARKDPGKITYGSSGSGGSIHLSAVLLEKMANITMVHVPYKGNAPALTDLLAGRISFMFADIPQVSSFIKEGKVKAIAVTTLKRSPALPDVPTIAESGLPGYDVSVWYGICGPAGMPTTVVAKLAREFKEVLQTPAVKDQLLTWGVQPVRTNPEEFESFVGKELGRWSSAIKSANIRLD